MHSLASIASILLMRTDSPGATRQFSQVIASRIMSAAQMKEEQRERDEHKYNDSFVDSAHDYEGQ